MSRIGVFICHCGENIGATVDCIKVAELAANMEGVAYAVDYKYMCSDPGQTLIKNAIKEYDLDGAGYGIRLAWRVPSVLEIEGSGLFADGDRKSTRLNSSHRT